MSVETGWVTEDDWKHPVKEGLLRKKGGRGHFTRKWSLRYFRLKNGSLFWFRSKNDDTCRGHIPLYGADIETNTEKTNKYEYCFRLYSRKLDRSYYLIADSQEELDSWIEAIKMETTTDSLARGGGRSAGNLLIESSDDGDTAF